MNERTDGWTQSSLMRRNSFEVFCSRYEGVSKSFRTGHLERELQMIQLSATGSSYIAVL